MYSHLQSKIFANKSNAKGGGGHRAQTLLFQIRMNRLFNKRILKQTWNFTLKWNAWAKDLEFIENGGSNLILFFMLYLE